LEKLNDSKDINRAWENIKENIKISTKETLGLHGQKQHKPLMKNVHRFEVKGSRLKCSGYKIQTRVTQRKQAKMHWLQDPNQSNLNILNNARCEASRYFRNKKSEYLKAKINELEINSKNKNIRELYSGTLRKVTSLELT
jgi:RNase P/RNase MRP subunit p29